MLKLVSAYVLAECVCYSTVSADQLATITWVHLNLNERATVRSLYWRHNNGGDVIHERAHHEMKDPTQLARSLVDHHGS